MLKSLRDRRLVTYDPQMKKVDHMFASYDETQLNLSEDEFVLIAGREDRDDEIAAE